VAIFRAGSHQ